MQASRLLITSWSVMRPFIIGLILIFILCSLGVKANPFCAEFFGDCGDPGIECIYNYRPVAQSSNLFFNMSNVYSLDEVKHAMGGKSFFIVYDTQEEELMVIDIDNLKDGALDFRGAKIAVFEVEEIMDLSV